MLQIFFGQFLNTGVVVLIVNTKAPSLVLSEGLGLFEGEHADFTPKWCVRVAGWQQWGCVIGPQLCVTLVMATQVCHGGRRHYTDDGVEHGGAALYAACQVALGGPHQALVGAPHSAIPGTGPVLLLKQVPCHSRVWLHLLTQRALCVHPFHLSQEKLNQVYEGPDFSIASRYPMVLVTLFVSLM